MPAAAAPTTTTKQRCTYPIIVVRTVFSPKIPVRNSDLLYYIRLQQLIDETPFDRTHTLALSVVVPSVLT